MSAKLEENMTAVYDIGPCNLVQADRRFGASYASIIRAVIALMMAAVKHM
jgi:hypothetical protein